VYAGVRGLLKLGFDSKPVVGDRVFWCELLVFCCELFAM